MNRLNNFFNTLWQQYTAICPQALAIHTLFESEGEALVNDHVAFRTFSNSCIEMDQLENEIFTLGYSHFDDYHFELKKLNARSYVHTRSPTKIFISELITEDLSESAQNIIKRLTCQVNQTSTVALSAGRLWGMPSYFEYQTLLEESEYAAWLSVWGLRANHFTLSVNHFKKYAQIADLISFLHENNFTFNTSGGLVKGTESDLLIQAATMADQQSIAFSDQNKQQVSSCYYEFAQRFKDPSGQLYQGFVTENADKIFESTNQSTAPFFDQNSNKT